MAQVCPASAIGAAEFIQYLQDKRAEISSLRTASDAVAARDYSNYTTNYLSEVGDDLSRNGASYTSAQLQQMRENLKAGYAAVKAGYSGLERNELLSAYRSAMGKLTYLASVAKTVESKSIEDILQDKSRSVCQRLGIAQTWANRKYAEAKTREQKLSLAEQMTSAIIYGLPQVLADENYSLSALAQKRYQNMVSQICALDQCAGFNAEFTESIEDAGASRIDEAQIVADRVIAENGLDNDCTNIVPLGLADQARMDRQAAVRAFPRGYVQQKARSAGKKVAQAAVAALVALGLGCGMVADTPTTADQSAAAQYTISEQVDQTALAEK
jgi:hypothetical protein